MTQNVKGEKTIFLACEFICFALLSIGHKYLLEGSSANIAYYTDSYDSALLIIFFAPGLIGLGLILLAYHWNGHGKVAFLVPILFIMALVLIFYAKANINSDAFNYFTTNYSIYLMFLSILGMEYFGFIT
jgi:hypothetical protein